jgi:hypothetical protein
MFVEGQFRMLVDVASQRDEFLNGVVAESFQGRAPGGEEIGSQLPYATPLMNWIAC